MVAVAAAKMLMYRRKPKLSSGILSVLPYFCRNFLFMQKTRKNTGIWWLVFLASTALLIFAIFDRWEYLTLILPIFCTSFVKALDII
jgi:hypothetical protein